LFRAITGRDPNFLSSICGRQKNSALAKKAAIRRLRPGKAEAVEAEIAAN
jgi:hypothetical protein